MTLLRVSFSGCRQTDHCALKVALRGLSAVTLQSWLRYPGWPATVSSPQSESV